MTKKERALRAVEALRQEYTDALCSLDWGQPHELLISTRLSAQCTDARVNLITPALFARYPRLEDYCDADLEEVEGLIRSCGFYHTKARDIIAMCRMLRDEYGGVIPDSIEELIKLPGVGRKTANLICGDLYGQPAVVADTHLIRLSNRIGLVATKNPLQVELQLKKLLPPAESNNFCHRCVLHGRAVCAARSPKCGICCMADFCKSAGSFGK